MEALWEKWRKYQYRFEFRPEWLIFLLIISFLFIFLIYPTGILLHKSLTDASGTFTLVNYAKAFTKISEPLINSLFVVGTVTVFSLLIAIPLGFLVARTDLPFKLPISILLIVPYMTPSYALSMGWVLLFTKNGVIESIFGIDVPFNVYGAIPIIIVQTVHLFPFAFIVMADGFAQMNPEIIQAARIHGSDLLTTMRRIVLPLLLPAILSGGILVFAYAMAEFGPAMILGIPVGFYVLTTQIYTYVTALPIDMRMASAFSIFLILIISVAVYINYWILGKRRYTTVGGKPTSFEVISLGKLKYPVLAICLLFLFLILVMPYIAVFFAATMDVWGKGYTLSNLTLRNFQYVLFESGATQRSIINVIILAVVAGAASVGIGLVLSYMVIRVKGNLSKLLDFLSFMPFIVPGTVFGVALILAFAKPPLAIYGTLWILLVMYTVHFIPIVTRSGTAALMQIDEELEDAGRIFGASWIGTFRKILLPLVKGAAFGAFILVFVSVMKEVSGASIVFSAGKEVAPVEAILRFSQGAFSQAAALSCILVFMVLAVTVVGIKSGVVKFIEVRG